MAAGAATPLARAPRLAYRWSWLPPALVAALVGVLYLLIDPRTSDLPTHLFRADLFEREGFVIWSNQWYGGHHTVAYSVLFPPLAWLLGPAVVGALSAVASAGLFERIARAGFGERARWGALWFAVATGSQLFTDRLPFMLGVAIGLGAVLALQRRRAAVAAGLAATCGLASPVAGAFLALAGAAYFVAVRRGAGAVLAAAALLPPVLVAIAFPEGGHHPFAFSSFIAVPLFAAAYLALLPPRERVLRVGAILYALAALAAFAIDTPIGGNTVRLGMLFGGPVLLCAAWPVRRSPVRVAAFAAVLLALAYWQWAPAVTANLHASEDPAVEAAYYEPLLGLLAREPPAGRLEIPFTRSHFEASEVARRYALARGWQRQLDAGRNSLFYDGELTHAAYATWLRENAVSHVAVDDGPADYSAIDERRLIDERPDYLRPAGAAGPWRLFEVVGALPLVTPEGGADIDLVERGISDFTLRVEKPGTALVRIRWTPYWLAEGGCVEPAGRWTRVSAPRAGELRVVASFSPERVLSGGRRCG